MRAAGDEGVFDDLEVLERRRTREEDRADEERDAVCPEPDERHVAGNRPERKAGRTDHEQDGDPPRARAPGKGRARPAGEQPLAVRARAPDELGAAELVDGPRHERPRPLGADGAGALRQPAPPPAVPAQWWNPAELEASRTGHGLGLEVGQLTLDVLDEQLRHVVGEAELDDHPQGREVGPVRGEGVGGQQPAALPQRVRDVEDGVVLDLVLELEGEHRQLVASGDQLERARSPRSGRRAASRRRASTAAPCGSRRTRAAGSCSTAPPPAHPAVRS